MHVHIHCGKKMQRDYANKFNSAMFRTEMIFSLLLVLHFEIIKIINFIKMFWLQAITDGGGEFSGICEKISHSAAPLMPVPWLKLRE
jgi:hypothetical protein